MRYALYALAAVVVLSLAPAMAQAGGGRYRTDSHSRFDVSLGIGYSDHNSYTSGYFHYSEGGSYHPYPGGSYYGGGSYYNNGYRGNSYHNDGYYRPYYRDTYRPVYRDDCYPTQVYVPVYPSYQRYCAPRYYGRDDCYSGGSYYRSEVRYHYGR